MAITDSEGNVIEQRYFDAWGNLGAAKIKGVNQTINALGWTAGLLIDRGYTGHEHLYTGGIDSHEWKDLRSAIEAIHVSG